MTTMNREEQKQVLIDTANHIIHRDNTSPYSENLRELARIALAALEVEPIGFRCRRNDNLGDWSYVYHREPDDFERKHLVIEGIYAAPPVPVVPEEKPMPNPLSMYAVDAVAAIAEVRGWNACRAAMLQSQNNGIKDGWISCSERMPPQDDWILIYSKHGEYMAGQVQGEYVELSDGTLSWLGNALFWMPLPEPPQEAK
ncbi:hypothetical protein DP048_14750 [Escherichia coli O109]|nr:hypothetical protein [Escherichia coli O109]